MRLGIHILIDRALRRLDLRLLDGSLELVLSGLHQRRVEGTTYLQRQGTLGTGSLQLLASLVDGIKVARDHKLTGAVIVGGHHYTLTHLAYLGTNLLNLIERKCYDGSHRRGLSLAGLLHSHGTRIDQLQSVLKTEGTGSRQGRELTQ